MMLEGEGIAGASCPGPIGSIGKKIFVGGELPSLSAIPTSADQMLMQDGWKYRQGLHLWPMRRVVLGFWIWVSIIACTIAVTECLKDIWATNAVIAENARLEAEELARRDSLRVVLRWGRNGR